MKLVHWPWGDEGTGRSRSPPMPILAVPNVTARPSTAGHCTNHCIAVYWITGLLLCSFNVPIKGLTRSPRVLCLNFVRNNVYSPRLSSRPAALCHTLYNRSQYYCFISFFKSPLIRRWHRTFPLLPSIRFPLQYQSVKNALQQISSRMTASSWSHAVTFVTLVTLILFWLIDWLTTYSLAKQFLSKIRQKHMRVLSYYHNAPECWK